MNNVKGKKSHGKKKNIPTMYTVPDYGGLMQMDWEYTNLRNTVNSNSVNQKKEKQLPKSRQVKIVDYCKPFTENQFTENFRRSSSESEKSAKNFRV